MLLYTVKPVLSGHSKEDQKLVFFRWIITECRLNVLQNAPFGAFCSTKEHSAVLLTCIKVPHGFWTFSFVDFQWLLLQGSHRLEKCLNLEGFLEESLNIKSAIKSTGKSLKSLEKSLNSIFSVDRELNYYKIVVPIFVAAFAAPNKGTTILY